MGRLTDYPLLVFALSFIVMWLSAWLGARVLRPRLKLDENAREDFGLVLAATLTLLGLIIGFSFSMATSRYDQRKNYEEAEANAIGTEWVRADLLPAADAARVRVLLLDYTEQRILNYTTRDLGRVREIDARTATLQADLWSAIRPAAKANPTPVMALVVSGMNDVLNSQGYTQAAWWNRIPTSAVILMAAIAIGCNLLVGYGSPSVSPRNPLLAVLPLLVALALTLIADIDTPRHGVIHVSPNNLTTLLQSLRSS